METKNERVLDFTGAKGKMIFTDTNLAGTARINVKLVNAKGEVRKAYLSTPVTEEIRSGKRTKDSIAFLDLVVDTENSTAEDIVYRVQRKQGNEIVVEMASLNLKETVQTAATFEEALGY